MRQFCSNHLNKRDHLVEKQFTKIVNKCNIVNSKVIHCILIRHIRAMRINTCLTFGSYF